MPKIFCKKENVDACEDDTMLKHSNMMYESYSMTSLNLSKTNRKVF